MLGKGVENKEGVEVVLTTDETLLSEYRNIPLGQFFSCVPSDMMISRMVHRMLMPKTYASTPLLEFAPMGLRRFEAAAARDIGQENVAVVSPHHLHRFIGSKTKIVGIHTMDPLGLGPVSLMFTCGGKYNSFTKFMFRRVLQELPEKRDFKVVVGGCGTWQMEYFPEKIREMGIDHVVSGECDHLAGGLIRKIENGTDEEIIRIKEPAPIETIMPNRGATMIGLVEVMRGCGRGCRFCQPNMRKARFIPFETIKSDILLNLRKGYTKVWVHSDDIFLYKVESKEFYPNKEAIKELFSFIMGIKGVTRANPTHGSLAAIASSPELIEELSKILRAGSDRWIGIQPGLETGSARLMEKIMPRKTLPFQPSEWPEVVINAVRILNRNHWMPGMTLIIGLPEETKEDVEETIALVDRMEKEGLHFIVAPLAFVPLAAWREKGFFDFAQQFDEARFNLVYKCWKHTVREIDTMFDSVARLNGVTKLMLDALAKQGSRYVLRHIEKWGMRKGFKVLVN
ncbi:MAG: B12-binding domain-containing radical SAM protein [Thermoplasmata archaeon]